MSEKKSCIQLLCFLAAGLVLTALFVFCVDPFYHYHNAWFGIPVVLENAVYQTPGAARNFDYDSVIVGTSMTENFRASWFAEELGWNTVKLSYSGARTDDMRAILDEVFSRKEPPAHIVMDINAYQLTEPSWSRYADRPQYLYDRNPITDISYLYNHDVALAGLNRILDRLENRQSDLDAAYTWEDPSYFGRLQAQESARQIREDLTADGAAGKHDRVITPLSSWLEVCDQNLDNITPFIEMYPETEFVIFYPPYSMLYWEQEVLKGELEEMMQVYRHSLSRLLSYENVTIYYFQDEEEIITNLDNYRDVSHYGPQFNRYIFECIRDGKNVLTEDNMEEHLDKMYKFAEGFDYYSLWQEEETNP